MPKNGSYHYTMLFRFLRRWFLYKTFCNASFFNFAYLALNRSAHGKNAVESAVLLQTILQGVVDLTALCKMVCNNAVDSTSLQVE